MAYNQCELAFCLSFRILLFLNEVFVFTDLLEILMSLYL
jgi:hypothetical protein